MLFIFNIISCLIKLILNLFVISFSLFFNDNLQNKIQKSKIFEIIFKLLYNILMTSILLPILSFFWLNFSKIKNLIKKFFLIINLNIFFFTSVFILFIVQLSYFIIFIFFIFFLFLKLIIIDVKNIIFKNSIGFFIIIKKPIEFLNIISKSVCISKVYKLFFNFIKMFNTYIRINYILLTKYSLFLKILFIYTSYFIKIIHYVYIIILQFFKINTIKLIKLSINAINVTINLISKFYLNCRNIFINLFFSVPIFLYTFLIYFIKFNLRKYVKFCIYFIYFHLNKIKLMIINLPMYLYNNFKYHLKQSSKVYIYALQSIYIYFRRLFKVLSFNLGISIFYKKLKIYIKKKKFFILFLKKTTKNLLKVCYSIILHCIHAYSFIYLTLCLAYIGDILRQKLFVNNFNTIVDKLLRNKLITVTHTVISLFLSSLSTIVLFIYFHYTQLKIYIKSIICFIFFKITQKLIYIVQKTYIRIAYSIRQKMMLFMSPRQKFHFHGYPILRRVGRRIRIIRRYFRLQSRYVVWNVLNHCFSVFFLLVRFVIFFILIAPFKFVELFLYPSTFIISFFKYVFVICYIVFLIPVLLFNSIKNFLFNCIFFLLNFLFLQTKNLISILIKGFNLLLIKLNLFLYKFIYNGLLITNKFIKILMHILQLNILIISYCYNNIINIIIIISTLIQYIIIRILEFLKIICMIILKLSYKLFLKILIKPITIIYYLLLSVIYLIYILTIVIIKQIMGVIKILLYLTIAYGLIPIRYMLKPIKRCIRVFYFYDWDYHIDRYILKCLRFCYNASYALTGLTYYGTIFLFYESIIFITTKKKKIFIFFFFLTLIYLYSMTTFHEEVLYCMALTPNELINYMIQLTSDLSKEMFLYLNHLLIELKTNILTYEAMCYFLNSIKNFSIIFLISLKNIIIASPEIFYIEMKKSIINSIDGMYIGINKLKNHYIFVQIHNMFFMNFSFVEYFNSFKVVKFSKHLIQIIRDFDLIQIIKDFYFDLKIIFNKYYELYLKRIIHIFEHYFINNYNILRSIVTLDFANILLNINNQFMLIYKLITMSQTFILIDLYIQFWIDYFIEIYQLTYNYVKSGYFLCNVEMKIKQQLIIFLTDILINLNLDLNPIKLFEFISRVSFFF